MKIEPFNLERWLNSISTCEIDLAQGVVMQLKLRDVTTDIDFDRVLTYGITNGSELLRAQISTWFSDINSEHILITSGTTEANLLVNLHLLEQEDEYVAVYPMYKQTVGFVESLGCKIKATYLDETRDWMPDLGSLNEVVSRKTKIIFFDNPNNPTGAILTEKEVRAICEIAEDVGAYVVCDNALRGSEIEGKPAVTPFLFYDRGVITGSVSKFGMIGLRIGWIIGSKELVKECLQFKDYTTLSHAGISEYLAECALKKDVKEKIIQRNLKISRTGLNVLSEWVEKNREIVSLVPPKAGFTAFLKYNIDLGSEEFCRKFLEEEGVLLAPGEFFGVDQHIRINIGCDSRALVEALNRLEKFLKGFAEI